MSKNRIVLYLGIFLFIIPFLGFPSTWKNIFSIIIGIILVALSISNSIKRRMRKTSPVHAEMKETIS